MGKALVVYVYDKAKSRGFYSWAQKFGYDVIVEPSRELLDTTLENFEVVKCVMDAHYTDKNLNILGEDRVRFFIDSFDTRFLKMVFDKFAVRYGGLADKLFAAISDNPDCLLEACEQGIPAVEQMRFPYADFFRYEPERELKRA